MEIQRCRDRHVSIVNLPSVTVPLIKVKTSMATTTTIGGNLITIRVRLVFDLHRLDSKHYHLLQQRFVRCKETRLGAQQVRCHLHLINTADRFRHQSGDSLRQLTQISVAREIAAQAVTRLLIRDNHFANAGNEDRVILGEVSPNPITL